MRLLFKLNVNDKYNPRKVYLAGQEYDIDDKRGKELLKALPNQIERVDKSVRSGKPTRNDEKNENPDKGDGEQDEQAPASDEQTGNEDNTPTETNENPDKGDGDEGSASEK